MSYNGGRIHALNLVRDQPLDTHVCFGTHEDDPYGLVLRKIDKDAWRVVGGSDDDYWDDHEITDTMVDDPSPWAFS